MSTNVALNGQRAAERQNYLPWLFLGIVGSFFGAIFVHASTPPVPTDVLATGPTDANQQQVFMNAYIGRAKSMRIKFVWLGVAAGVVLSMGACVACGLAIGSASTTM